MYDWVEFYSRKSVEAFDEKEGSERRVLISATSPNTKGSRQARIHPHTWSDVLFLAFHDIDPNTRSSRKKQTDLVYFDEEMAYQIIAFIKKHEGKNKQFYVNCEAGISRSAGIAKFIAQIYNLDFPPKYSLYNKHVFSTLLSTYGKCSYGEGRIQPQDLPGYQLQEQT